MCCKAYGDFSDMTLIKSISGFRGTIGGAPSDGLSPIEIAKSVSAYASLREKVVNRSYRRKIVVGRDARISGEMVSHVVCGTLMGMGFDVINIGLASTPTTELAVVMEHAVGGIILTASHNPMQWNALKLLNAEGEFISGADGKLLQEIANNHNFRYADVKALGSYSSYNNSIQDHIDAVLRLPLVNKEAIEKANFSVVVDPVNSTGAISIPPLLKQLGVKNIKVLNEEPNGLFAHNPEPIPENLTGISEAMKKGSYDLGIVVDPDVDRLAFICENGQPFVEEYTLVSVADYLLDEAVKKGRKDLATVSNLSSSRALRDVTEAHGGTYYAAAVGEVNVTTKMHEVNALIGGEGNGGVIYPASHCGRDAMVGVALFLSNLAHKGLSASAYKATLPQYFIAKNRIDLSDPALIDKILEAMKEHFKDEKVNTIDGVKIDFESRKQWVHLRKSNTEPIIRIYSEAQTEEAAVKLGEEVIALAQRIIG